MIIFQVLTPGEDDVLLRLVDHYTIISLYAYNLFSSQHPCILSFKKGTFCQWIFWTFPQKCLSENDFIPYSCLPLLLFLWLLAHHIFPDGLLHVTFPCLIRIHLGWTRAATNFGALYRREKRSLKPTRAHWDSIPLRNAHLKMLHDLAGNSSGLWERRLVHFCASSNAQDR